MRNSARIYTRAGVPSETTTGREICSPNIVAASYIEENEVRKRFNRKSMAHVSHTSRRGFIYIYIYIRSRDHIYGKKETQSRMRRKSVVIGPQ
jgi:hypothetical protein